jgi:DNA-binding NarL/FixJ family response regulator
MSGQAYTVLIVDDSFIIQQRISEILSEVSCVTDVKIASGFEEAVSVLQKNKVDLALLDINLPGKNGIQLLMYIRENFPLIKTIMLTNQSDSYYRKLCERLGCDSFFDKSNEFELMIDRLVGYYSDSAA